MWTDSAKLYCQRPQSSPTPVRWLMQQVRGSIGSIRARLLEWGRAENNDLPGRSSGSETRPRNARGLLLAVRIQTSTLSRRCGEASSHPFQVIRTSSFSKGLSSQPQYRSEDLSSGLIFVGQRTIETAASTIQLFTLPLQRKAFRSASLLHALWQHRAQL